MTVINCVHFLVYIGDVVVCLDTRIQIIAFAWHGESNYLYIVLWFNPTVKGNWLCEPGWQTRRILNETPENILKSYFYSKCKFTKNCLKFQSCYLLLGREIFTRFFSVNPYLFIFTTNAFISESLWLLKYYIIQNRLGNVW